ncbi:MAG: hypothetical protein KAT68_10310 [Bacteroidales bacterium]|nr:hypothetical protein [Bacteroidales bacterium]
MKINKFYLLSLIIISVLILGFTIKSQVFKPEYNNGKKFKKEWAKVDSLEKKGLPKSALQIVDKIYKESKSENISDQLIKSLIFKMKYISKIEEDIFSKLVNDIDKEIKETQYPEKSILHSMLAEMYWMYYQNNRYKFINRSTTIDFDTDDINTWDLNKIIYKIIQHYQISLENPKSLKNTPINNYDEILIKGSKSQDLRPTLYDFLAHRAIDFFSNPEITLSQPADKFELREKEYFSDVKNFIQYDIQTSDTLSLHYYSVKILQELLDFRLTDKNTDALIDTDLKRLNFVYSNSVNELKDSLYLNALVDLENKYSKLLCSSEVSFLIAKYYNNRSNKYNPLIKETGIYKWDKKKAFETCEKVIKHFPDSVGFEKIKNLQAQIKKIDISSNIENVIIPEEKFISKINYRNLSKVYLQIAKIEKADIKTFNNRLNNRDLYEKLKKKSKIVYTKVIDLPDDGDFNKHSIEIILDKLPIGQYLLIISNNEKFSYDKNIVSFQQFTVSNLSYIQRNSRNGSINIYVFNRKTGETVNNVKAQIWFHKYDYSSRNYKFEKGSEYITDSEGYFEILPEKNIKTRNFLIEFTYENDYLNTESYLYLSSGYISPSKKIIKTFFFTDRAIYRPGQTVHFKGIILAQKDDKNQILANSPTTVSLYDVNYQKIQDIELTTNEFGTISGTFVLPRGLLNGRMQIKNKSGSKYISVEEYKRPKFEVKIQPIKSEYILNDKVKIKGSAISFAGSNITDAKVSFRVVRTPLWRSWFYPYFQSSKVEILNGNILTNENGEFEFEFTAIPDLSIPKNNRHSFNYSISIDVTDINGETQSTSKNIAVGHVALITETDIPANVNKNNVKKFKILTKNFGGEFVEASGEIKIYKLKEPKYILRNKLWEYPDTTIYSQEKWYSEFPGNVYMDEANTEKLKIEKEVINIKFDTKINKEFELKNLINWDNGRYKTEIISKDKFGNKVQSENYFTVYSDKDKSVPFPTIDWYVPEKTNCEPGETAKILIGSSLEKVKILYEIENRNKIIEKKWLVLKNKQQLIEIPIIEKYRGNISIYFTFISNNRIYKHNEIITVPYSNKELDISFETFRNKLYPGENEEWKIKISSKNADKVAAEMLATLYDASLDQFVKNYWNFNIYKSYYSSLSWQSSCFESGKSILLKKDLDKYYPVKPETYNTLNWFGFYYFGSNIYSYGTGLKGGRVKTALIQESTLAPSTGEFKDETESDGEDYDKETLDEIPVTTIEPDKHEEKKTFKIRSNFNETAFFYPHMETDDKGNILIKFIIPDALTRWKMLGFAHTKDLKYGFIDKELITQKELMVLPNLPRFFRERDTIYFPVKISNLSEKELKGTVKFEICDAINFKTLNHIIVGKSEKNFTVAQGQNTNISWQMIIPEGIQAINYKIIAKSGNFSDGEENIIPVLTNKILVTESLPLPIRAKETKNFEFKKLTASKKSSTLTNFRLTLEFTSNPAWYAVQALPYIMEYPYECSEQVFSRFYANSIATHIANSSPKIKKVFDTWKNIPDSKSFLSNLEKNQELKNIILEETPWVMNSQDESERKRRVGLLFDMNKMANELGTALSKLKQMQTSNGAWPWFSGMPESRYITQHIVTGFGHLDNLGIKDFRKNSQYWNMIKYAVNYLDIRIKEDYDKLKKRKNVNLEDDHLSNTQIHYLYARSYFNDITMNNSSKKAFEYYKNQCEKYWVNKNKYLQGMIALSLNRYQNKNVPAEIIKSLSEYALHSEEMGMYWKSESAGYYWHQAPIETQALMIELYSEVANDKKSVEELKVWLLKQKQTQDWKTTKATVEAIYALLLRGSDILANNELVKITIGDIIIDPENSDDIKPEAGTGYFKTSWSGKEIKAEMGNVKVINDNEVIAWGALYWQYFEQLDKITTHETPLKLKKQLFKEIITKSGKVIKALSPDSQLDVGDKIIVRIELRVDRNMEYVHMKDMRASGFEPINVFSGYKYQGGLGYYESTKDAATNFFISYLRKGTYVFEYSLRVSHSGNFSNGITTIQCMYAPEFTSHSEGVRVNVGLE